MAGKKINGTQSARDRLWALRDSDDLQAWADSIGYQIDWDCPTWAILDAVIDLDPPCSSAGMDEEYVQMAARLAVRNIDPDYRGYTPFGSIAV